MTGEVWSKVKYTESGQIAERFELSDEAAAMLDPKLPPAEFQSRMLEAGLHMDAIRFLAHSLPKREAVWWACVCVRDSLSAEGGEPERDLALIAAESWVMSPNEETRRRAQTAAEAVQFETAGAWAAMAAFWSGGSMAPVESPPVAPDESLLGSAVAGAVMLAAARLAPEGLDFVYQKYLDLGQDIANGGTGTDSG